MSKYIFKSDSAAGLLLSELGRKSGQTTKEIMLATEIVGINTVAKRVNRRLIESGSPLRIERQRDGQAVRWYLSPRIGD